MGFTSSAFDLDVALPCCHSCLSSQSLYFPLRALYLTLKMERREKAARQCSLGLRDASLLSQLAASISAAQAASSGGSGGSVATAASSSSAESAPASSGSTAQRSMPTGSVGVASDAGCSSGPDAKKLASPAISDAVTAAVVSGDLAGVQAKTVSQAGGGGLQSVSNARPDAAGGEAAAATPGSAVPPASGLEPMAVDGQATGACIDRFIPFIV